MSADPALAAALLAELAREPGGMVLPRLCKRLGVRMSVLLRTLAWLGDARVAGVAGPGWVRVDTGDDARSVATLTDAGRRYLAEHGAGPG